MPDLTPNHDFAELSQLIEERRGRVARLVNTELIDLYWELGKRIELRITAHGWGRGTVTELADYLSSRTNGLRGFSSSNLWRMRQFYETWQDAPEKLATLLRELSWSAHLDLLGRCKTHEERQFYLIHAVQEGLSVRQLRKAIETANYERVSLADQKLATVSRVLQPHEARQFKDSYVLDFLGLPSTHSEQDLRKGLVKRLGTFLRELGRDFCFIGEEYPIQVGTRDGSIDLLFFHRGLNSLIAIELKVTSFEPAHLGQLNFYLEALDRDVRKGHENPSIGILLCASKDDEVVEKHRRPVGVLDRVGSARRVSRRVAPANQYALSRSLSPALVAEYQTKLPDKALLQAKLHEFLSLEAAEDNP